MGRISTFFREELREFLKNYLFLYERLSIYFTENVCDYSLF